MEIDENRSGCVLWSGFRQPRLDGTDIRPRAEQQHSDNITTAQFLRAQYEWYAHAPLAERAGVPAPAIETIRRGETPSFDQKDEALVYRVCTELFKTRRLSDATFNEAVATLAEIGLTEVIAIIGYYTLIGNMLNAFQVPVPEGTASPFPE